MSAGDLLKHILLAALAGAVLLHAFVPRYDWRIVEGTNTVTIVVYDKWTGRFQRGVYDDNGNLNVMGVFTPF